MKQPDTASGALAIVPLVFSLLVLSCAGSARAQDVVNPSFELPSVAQTTTGYIVDPPTTPEVGWTFSLLPLEPGTTVPSSSGVQKKGTGFGAPAAPDKDQTGYITNLGSIAQKIDFKKSGAYELFFKIAGSSVDNPANQSGSILVFVAGEKHGPYAPRSNSGFNEVTVPFTVAVPNASIELKFAGNGLGNNGQLTPGEISVVFIDAVSIKPAPPQIATWTNVLDPTSKVQLKGSHLGNDKGKIRIHFPQESKVSFGSKSSNSKQDLILDVDGAWTDDGTITSEQILQASPIGSVPAQTVEITVIAADGRTSNAVQASFQNKAVITGATGSLRPSGLIKLAGWDFGEAGVLKAQFPIILFKDFNQPDHSRINLDLETPAPVDKSWLTYAIKAKVPAVTGVVEQSVLLSFTTKDGRKSNLWPIAFFPRKETKLLLQPDVTVITCSDQGAANSCNPPNPESGCFANMDISIGAMGVLDNNSIDAFHDGCFGFDSDNGTDVFTAAVTNFWTVSSFAIDADSDANNGSIGVQPTPLPAPVFIVSIPWHIGATGGFVYYDARIMITGPKDVPYKP